LVCFDQRNATGDKSVWSSCKDAISSQLGWRVERRRKKSRTVAEAKKPIFVRAVQGKAKMVDDNRSLLDDFSMVNEQWD
jgi:hypothetical protein